MEVCVCEVCVWRCVCGQIEGFHVQGPNPITLVYPSPPEPPHPKP